MTVVLGPTFSGVPSVSMSPLEFIENPVSWLKGINEHRAQISGGPNFAYELCVQKVTPQEMEKLDLSPWKFAFLGTEAIQARVIRRFSQCFKGCGFQERAFFTGYGLSEATFTVSMGSCEPTPTVKKLNRTALAKHRVQEAGEEDQDFSEIVSCGQCLRGQNTAIVDPQTLLKCAPDQIGEIWVKGPSVGKGYWNQPELSKEIFQGFVGHPPEGPYLRTGDLGFFAEGHLFITGRKKDLIIIRGKNYYPQDIEATVEQAVPNLQAGSAAAFSIEDQGEEKLMIILERSPKDPAANKTLFHEIKKAILTQHQLKPHAILFAEAGALPKTLSNKLQRHLCKQFYLDGNLKILEEWRTPQKVPLKSVGAIFLTPVGEKVLEILQGLYQEEETITQESNMLTHLGLDSLEWIQFWKGVENTFRIEIPQTDMIKFQTLGQVIKYIQKRVKKKNSIFFSFFRKKESKIQSMSS